MMAPLIRSHSSPVPNPESPIVCLHPPPAEQIGYYHTFVDGVDFVFVDHPSFNCRGSDIYGGGRHDLMFRCALLSKAALEAVWQVPCGGVPYGDDNCVFVANDWHTALLPVYLQVREEVQVWRKGCRCGEGAGQQVFLEGLDCPGSSPALKNPKFRATSFVCPHAHMPDYVCPVQ